jgi:two-component system, OmpR family, alkaline phosphatase synthesis response regulator PhoP
MIWCVEDDASTRDIEVYALESTGFEARGFEDGNAFWQALQTEEPPELVVLDVMLPGIEGTELLSRMKSTPELRDIPVVMATAKSAEYDKVQGLDKGADYYLVKPFGVMELVSCVRAVLRRYRPQKEEKILTAGGLSVNLDEHIVTADGKEILLTYKEYELLKLFMSHPGAAFTRDQLMSQVWGTDYYGETRTVDMHIRTLRQKLGDYGSMIKTVRGVGYRMEVRHD